MKLYAVFSREAEATASFASPNIHNWLDIPVVPYIKTISVGTPFH